MRNYHWLVLVYTLVSALALAAVVLSAADWITPDPLSAIPAMLLGLPWSYMLTSLGASQSPTLNLLLVALGMGINAALIWLIGRRLSRD
ncbi:MAG TPA: hypothetical protein VMW05_10290 [Methyloceanibacter sp.]|nr:hypothetical protein [Methyloceanibacter sp.]